jgi:glycosyltransferase involved in cell wall biosynthesis
VDLGRFDFGRDDRRAERERRGWDDAVVGIFVGSTSPWHRADRAVAIAARVMAELPDVRFVAAVYPTAVHVAGMAEEAELPGDRCEFTTEDVDDVPRLLTAADFAFMLIERHVSKEVCAPIKFSEYMAAGLPVVASRAIGDISGWIEEGGLGVAIDHDDVEAAAGLVTEFLRSDDFRGGAARTRCLDFAAKELNMEQTLSDYEKLYEDLDIR